MNQIILLIINVKHCVIYHKSRLLNQVILAEFLSLIKHVEMKIFAKKFNHNNFVDFDFGHKYLSSHNKETTQKIRVVSKIPSSLIKKRRH